MSPMALTVLLALAGGSVPAGGGVVVVEVEAGGTASLAGLAPGDRIVRWSRDDPAASGGVDSPFDLSRIEIEEAPLGRITVHGGRDGAPFSAELSPGEWKLATRPALASEVLSLYERAEREGGLGNAGEAIALLREAAGSQRDPRTRAWLVSRGARPLGDADRWDEAKALVAETVAAYGTSDDPKLAPLLWRDLGVFCESKSAFDVATEAHGAALAAARSASPDGLLEAECGFRLGSVMLKRGDLAGAEENLLAALRLREALAPGSVEQARTLNNLGVMYRRRGGAEGYALAEKNHEAALEITRAIAPDGYDAAYSHMALGSVSWMRGDLSAASRHYGDALPIFETVAPGTLGHAAVLQNLGNVMTMRGDLADAEDVYRRVAEIRQKIAPEGLEVAMSYGTLGAVCMERGDFEMAEDYWLRSLAIRERLAPGSEEMIESLLNLGAIHLDLGELAEAEDYYTRALRLAEKRSGDNEDVALTLRNLGKIAAQRGDHGRAETLLLRSRDILEKLTPKGLKLARALYSLGQVAESRGNLDTSLRYFGESLEIRTSRAPESRQTALSAAAVGRVLRRQGKPGEAIAMLRRAISVLEAQEGRLGGADTARAEFRSINVDIYREAIDQLVDLDRDEEAFELLERSRARGLLSLLAERDMVFSADIPEDLDRRRRTVAGEYDQARERLAAGPEPPAGEKAQALEARLRALRRELDEIRQEIRVASPRLAALQEPRALDLASAIESLDHGTAALSYSVGRDRTLVFAIGARRKTSVVPLAIGNEELSSRILEFRRAIAAAGIGPAAEESRRLGELLYDVLVAPVSGALDGADRLLIVPDGPLHLLPFAALRIPDGKDGGARYLVERLPLHLAASLSVHEELKSARNRARPDQVALVAFGDPRYARESGAPAARRTLESEPPGASPAARALDSLPGTGQEVRAITRLFGDRARMFVQEEASESKARDLGPGIGMIHFAAHAIVDERHPLDSAIALSVPSKIVYGRDNGLLQAWEIFESLRLDADLVTLSGCDTALGRELAGEGMIGLTRAFQYAGARAVAASLWHVSDESTAALMERFYGYLKEGRPKDEALRSAQIDLIRGGVSGDVGGGAGERGVKVLAKSGSRTGSYALPLHWAAFQIYGDWK